MRVRSHDHYRCDECGFEADVTRPPRATSTSEETLCCCCGRCGAEIVLVDCVDADRERNSRIPQAESTAQEFVAWTRVQATRGHW